MSKRLARIGFAWLLAAAVTALPACSSHSTNGAETASSPAATAVTAEPPVEGDSAGSKEAIASVDPSAPGSKGYLWKVTGGGNSGYLIGTIHVAKKNMYPLDPNVEQAIEEANYIALELDLTKVDQKKMLELVNEKALLTDGTTLKDHVDEKDYEKFQAILKKSILAAAAPTFDQYEPWYAAMNLESLSAMKYMLNDGIDQYLAKKAHKEGKTIIELESMESQLDIFDGFSKELQKQYFHESVENMKNAAKGMEDLLEMWTAGDLKKLEQMHEEYEKEGRKSMGDEFEDYNGAFLDDRNAEMAKKIDGYLREGDKGTYLVAVGSLHMVGDQGLVSLLRKKGYQVEFVK
ncbi:TraB/GumN family protein [Cohnella terricola]|uniref:TraB/GumN family protein n=1 Tax=Cohnella terricola TaxID=1289167 RepID=A0A559JSW7_9BACL|nr:TraB/GumN family protein [Cohnella terricola]TVY02965.1 TraB/GumN family protein [Cohnella terricola]